LENYKKVLVLAVGGGNDSVSTLLLQLQLNKTFGYNPEQIDIVAVLPDCLEYDNIINTNHSLVSIITKVSIRSIDNKIINAFPERILSQNKNIFPTLNINNIYGLSMIDGSFGILSALKYLLLSEEYDLVLSIDVGGDFIADKDNLEVLSPMMDGFMLYALKKLKSYIQKEKIKTEMLFSIFGLGTDGESTPKMLKKAMSLIPDIKEYSFNQEDVNSFITFYRDIVEPNRYSRTTDYTILEISNQKKDNPSKFRGRFHTKTDKDIKSKVYYGNFNHFQDESYFGKYYLFRDINNINNIYSKGVNSGLSWFINVQKQDSKINHELNGQSYSNIGKILNDSEFDEYSLLFATPSRKFNDDLQKEIVKDVSLSILNEVYDFALIYNEYESILNEKVIKLSLNKDLSIIGLNKNLLIKLKDSILKHIK
jgi:hypothetical protein